MKDEAHPDDLDSFMAEQPEQPPLCSRPPRLGFTGQLILRLADMWLFACEANDDKDEYANTPRDKGFEMAA
jgi:hypothetical protein